MKNVNNFIFRQFFDGHGGIRKACCCLCLSPSSKVHSREIFPKKIESVISSAFLQMDTSFAEACLLDAALSSGTVALTALVVGRLLVVANAGDCRAVLCRRGKAIEMSKDHKPIRINEHARIESCSGYMCPTGTSTDNLTWHAC